MRRRCNTVDIVFVSMWISATALAALPNCLYAQAQLSAKDVLAQADLALDARANVTARYDSKGAGTSKLRKEDWIRRTSGLYRYSGGRRYCERHMELAASDGSVRELSDNVLAWDGKRANTLFEFESTKEGFIDSSPHGVAMEDGDWLLTGEITGVSEGRADADSESLFGQLAHLDPSQLKIVTERTDQGDPVYRISGKLAWGRCEIWIEPKRDFSLVRLVADVTCALFPDGVHYETTSIELSKIDGKWVPYRATLQTTVKQRAGDIVDVIESRTEISLAAIKFLSGDEPDSKFRIDFPKGILIRDRILDITYGKESEHPLDNMQADLLKDKAWIEQHRTRPLDSASDSVSNEIAKVDSSSRPIIITIGISVATLAVIALVGAGVRLRRTRR